MIASSTSAETVGNIEELLTQILLRVPAGTLIGFKCVSKHWLSLISSPSFCNSHTLQNPKISAADGFFIFREKRSEAYYSISPLGFCSVKPLNLTARDQPAVRLSLLRRLYIVDSLNGLLLCQFMIELYGGPYHIVNAATSQCFEIPTPDVDLRDKMFYIIAESLVVDPRKPYHYKVVRCLFTLWEGIKRMYIEVYSSESRRWRMMECSFTLYDCIKRYSGKCYNNRIHWINWKFEMVHYDLDDGSPGVVPTPDSQRFAHSVDEYREEEVSFFGESGGRLLLIIRGRFSLTQFDVLQLERDYSAWSVKYKMNLDNLAGSRFTIVFLATEENEAAEDDSCLFLRTSDKLISYNIRDGTSKTVSNNMNIYTGDAYYYSKTLALV